MASRTGSMTDAMHAYLVDVSVHESDAMRRLREVTATHERAMMQIGPEQGAFMAWLVGLMGARRGIEVGTFTGYSALALTRAMPDDGVLVCCDISAEYTAVGAPFWAQDGVADKIDLRIAPALETLDALLAGGGAGTYDYAFIDADKTSYDSYYERCLSLLRVGGVVMIDNVFWGGAVADPARDDDSTVALRALNAKIGQDARVGACMVPIGDGLTLAQKL